MTATVPAYYGQISGSWGTTTTTMDTARRNLETEDRSATSHDIVVVLAPSKTVSDREERKSWYWGSQKVFVLEAPAGTLPVTATTESLIGSSGIDQPAWRGIFAMHHTRNILFSQLLTTRTESLRRLIPRVHIDRRTYEREDA